MWLIFINKLNNEIIEYVNVKSSDMVSFDNEMIKFYQKNRICYYRYDEWYFDDSFCDNIQIDNTGEERFLNELLSRISIKFKEVQSV